jgi:RimJ/RimL family protein N-acetyltransferase
MGVAAERIPSPAQMRSDVQNAIATSDKQTRSFTLVWCLDGEAIGHSSLKDIRPAECGSIHLHIWRSDLRGKGYGPALFCLAVLEFYERFKLDRMICEPKANNPVPNKMLHKIGFPLVSTRIGRSSELSIVCELNRYDIIREIAQNYLETHLARIARARPEYRPGEPAQSSRSRDGIP